MFYESNKQGQGIIFNTIMMSSPPGDGAEINTFLGLLFISVTDTMRNHVYVLLLSPKNPCWKYMWHACLSMRYPSYFLWQNQNWETITG